MLSTQLNASTRSSCLVQPRTARNVVVKRNAHRNYSFGTAIYGCMTQRTLKESAITPQHTRIARGSTIRASAAHHVYEGQVHANPGARFAIVVGRFNDLVTKLLLEGALGTFERHGVMADNIDVAWVPGSFELPVVAKSMAETGVYDAVVCIGVVVRGATAHYDAVVSGTTSGVLSAGVTTGVPVIFGVLTCDTMEQALDRAGGKVGNKGGEAAATAVEMGNLMRKLRVDGKAVSAPAAK